MRRLRGLRRWLLPAALAAAVIVALILIIGGGGGGNKYVVRAVFENGSFMVHGEQVRVAGANVGTIESVTVTMPGEIDSYEGGRPQSVPGKAVLVMNITDEGFQDFRRDASCLIRPQSLIGEKFVDCRPTLPRAPGSPPPPPLHKIPSGQPGAGQYLLPLENNSTSVDSDLVNNIQQLPYAQRFRLILNELGAGLAARGKDIEEVVKRANPVLRDADRLLGTLNGQRDRLAQLASDSETILRPLAREKAHFAGFLTNAGAAAEASSERGAELEASLQKFPRFLREFRLTLHSLKGFSDQAAPVFTELGVAAPSLTTATRELTPFSAASTVSLKSLGAAAETAGPPLREADPIVRKARDLARTGVSPTSKLAKTLVSVKKNKGFDGLVDLIYNSTGSLNEFDNYGHFVRSFVVVGNCTNYVIKPESGCVANFSGPGHTESEEAFSSSALYQRIQQELGEKSGGTGAGSIPKPPLSAPPANRVPAGPEDEEEQEGREGRRRSPQLGEGRRLGASYRPSSAQRALLDYLLGP
jgi:phospholipid/cholesterol/gamma-HCH transport system substrate-binding protein